LRIEQRTKRAEKGKVVETLLNNEGGFLDQDRFQILSLDGGGIKGIFSAAVLAMLEEDLGIKITDHFDLITGTSTGGIIALGLGLGMRPRELVEFYTHQGPSIFSHRKLRFLRWLLHSKFSQEKLEDAVRGYFGDKLLGDSFKRLVIPSFNLEKEELHIFKTRNHSRFNRDHKVPAWKVGMATSAAPTYFPTFNKLNHARLIDGGIWANNPVMLGLIEALSVLNVPRESISILSIGTTDNLALHPDNLDRGGLWQWKTTALDTALKAQSLGATAQASLLLGKDKVERLNPKVPDTLFQLDKLSTEKLIAHADHESRNFSPIFKEKFMSHIANEFLPTYTENRKEAVTC